MGDGDELPKEKCLEGIAKFPPASVTSQRKEAGVPGGNLLLELTVYQQDRLAQLQPLVSGKSGKGTKINSSLPLQTPEWEGRARRQGMGAPSAREGPRGHQKPKIWSLDSL